MFDERLFYYIHGLATMFFLLEGLRRLRSDKTVRLNRMCGYVLLCWGALELKDLAFYHTLDIRYNYLSNLLILIDLLAVPAGCIFIIELLNSGWCTLRRVLGLVSPFIIGITAYALTAYEPLVDAVFIFVGCYCICFLIHLSYAVKRYNRYLNDNYSNTDYIHIRWLKGVAAMLAVCLVVWIYSCYHSSWVADSIYQVALVTMWATILFFADRQQPITFTPPSILRHKRPQKALQGTFLLIN